MASSLNSKESAVERRSPSDVTAFTPQETVKKSTNSVFFFFRAKVLQALKETKQTAS